MEKMHNVKDLRCSTPQSLHTDIVCTPRSTDTLPVHRRDSGTGIFYGSSQEM